MWRSTATRKIDQRANTDATDSLERQANEPSVTSAAHTEDEKTLFQSALVEILNPKTAIFYLAFYPNSQIPQVHGRFDPAFDTRDNC